MPSHDYLDISERVHDSPYWIRKRAFCRLAEEKAKRSVDSIFPKLIDERTTVTFVTERDGSTILIGNVTVLIDSGDLNDVMETNRRRAAEINVEPIDPACSDLPNASLR